MSDNQLVYFLSSGTTKGILLYTLMVASLKEGFDLMIDEVANHFHKTLVENMISLYKDKGINRKNATLVFTTHYCEVLDRWGGRITSGFVTPTAISTLPICMRSITSVLRCSGAGSTATALLGPPVSYDAPKSVKQVLIVHGKLSVLN